MSNSLETSLTALALSFFPWETSPSVSTWRGQFRASLALAALACAVRPTNVVIWVYMLLLLAYQLRGHFEKLRSVILDSAAIWYANLLFRSFISLTQIYVTCPRLSFSLAAVALLCGLDSLYYGKLTLTPLNFVLTNLSSVSLFYGSSPWHYYLTQGVPILCTTALPFVLHGSWLCLGRTSAAPARQLLGLVAWCIAVYSLAGHKEWRFLHPILPVMHLFAAKSLVDLYARAASRKDRKGAQRMLPIRTSHLCLLLVNIPLLFYLAQLHGRAQIDVMHYFRALPDDGVRSVGFLMPCHSTPWQAYLHKPTFADTYRFWSLGCEPPLEYVAHPFVYSNTDIGMHRSQVIQDYKDQTDVFYDSPITYLRTRFPSRVDMAFPPSPYPCSHPGVPQNATTNDWRHEWPQYIVAFGALMQEEGISEMFEDMGYKMVWRRNRGWEGDERRRGGIMVLKVD